MRIDAEVLFDKINIIELKIWLIAHLIWDTDSLGYLMTIDLCCWKKVVIYVAV